jgi:hypothetical protein
MCKNRKHQVVLVEDLKQDLLATDLDTSYVHTWKEVSNKRNATSSSLVEAWKIQQYPFWVKLTPMKFFKGDIKHLRD